jgi:hypothetical protein
MAQAQVRVLGICMAGWQARASVAGRGQGVARRRTGHEPDRRGASFIAFAGLVEPEKVLK